MATDSKYVGVAAVARAASHSSQSKLRFSGGMYVRNSVGTFAVMLSANIEQTKLSRIALVSDLTRHKTNVSLHFTGIRTTIHHSFLRVPGYFSDDLFERFLER